MISKWIRAGVAALPVYGLLTGWATLTHQPNAQVDFPAYARYISTPEFFAHHLVGSIGGSILMLYGSMALSAYLAGNESMAAINQAIYSMPLGLTGVTGGLLYALGTVLFGIAIWRSGALPKGAAVLYALAGPLLYGSVGLLIEEGHMMTDAVRTL